MKNALNLSLSILFLVVLGCSCPQKLRELANKERAPTPAPRSSPFSTSKPDDESTPSTSGKTGEYDLSLDKFKRINIGSSRSDVENILGGKGTEISNSVGGGVRFTVNKWSGDNYTAVILSFRNDKVMTKSQVGLK
jgi:hypothetical protein